MSAIIYRHTSQFSPHFHYHTALQPLRIITRPTKPQKTQAYTTSSHTRSHDHTHQSFNGRFVDESAVVSQQRCSFTRISADGGASDGPVVFGEQDKLFGRQESAGPVRHGSVRWSCRGKLLIGVSLLSSAVCGAG